MFSYQFSAPEVVNVYQEYIIYDTISMVAYTGGILGMCIGFSFINVTTNVINLLQNSIRIIKIKFTKKNLRPMSGFVKEDYEGTHLHSETETSTALGEYDKNKKTLETFPKEHGEQIKIILAWEGDNKDKGILENKVKEQEEQIKKLQQRLNILEYKQIKRLSFRF